jgi:hypothetical protein
MFINESCFGFTIITCIATVDWFSLGLPCLKYNQLSSYVKA